jgi:hypothetical protein
LDGHVVVWKKFECDAGCRWTHVKGGICAGQCYEGSLCDFSGCEKGHFVHARGETTDRHEAYAWFRNMHAEERGRQEEQCHNEAMEAAFGWHGQD